MSLSSVAAKAFKGKRTLPAVGMLGAVATVVAGAIIYPGFTTTDVDLNDGSVWVTNRSMNMVAHLNAESKLLDGGFAATTENFNVVQNAGNVFMDNAAGSLFNKVDVPSMALGQDTAMSGGKTLSLGGSITAIADPNEGNIWVMASESVTSFGDKTTKPTLTGMPGALTVVAQSVADGAGTGTGSMSADGSSTVFVLNPKASELLRLTVSADGKVMEQQATEVAGLPESGHLELSAVGDSAVVLDPEAGTLFLPGNKKVRIPNGKGGRLQHPSAEGSFAAVETAESLVVQPLNGDTASIVAGSGTGVPIAPVQQQNCVHAAWGGVNEYLFYCDGGDNLLRPIPHTTAQSALEFRQNREVVVLNDTHSGDVWLVNQNMLLVNNWDDISLDLTKADDPEIDSSDPNVVNTLPDRSKPNRVPEATADTFGVRAGRTTILPVLYNDSDPDGDVLTVAGPATDPAVGAVQTIYGGSGLQLAVPEEATGTAQFGYTANDGRGGTATATVNIRVVPESENSAPTPLRLSTMVVAQGQSVSQNVLTDWIDPDGDDIFLVGAVSEDGSAAIKTSPDGELRYTDDGEESGMKTMTVTVSDGQAQVEQQLKVNVRAAGSVPPVANADFFRSVAGESTVLAPLKNDQDPAGGTLRLASVSKPENGTISRIADNGTVTFTSSTPGVEYLEYQVTNGPTSATGLIRVDVVPAGETGPPIAVKDLALLPAGGSVLVDVLGNDMDPAGGVLVVQSVGLPSGAPISATIIDRHIVKLTDVRGLSQGMSLKYTISNGAGTATGEISVIGIPAPDKLLPPRVEADNAVVRVGDIVTIPVLANDVDPNGEVLKSPEIVESPSEDAGKLFVDQNQLRFIAGPTAKTVQGVYKVANSTGQFNSAPVTITIIAADPDRNLPPVPKNLQGRVIAGDTVKIPVPLDGIDPDGDSVELVGIEQAPAFGTAQPGNGFFLYTAAGTSHGTDTFSYTVRDRLGAQATARVDVGVVPPLAMNQPPITADDYITMRPGRKVALDVMLNDSDPDGGQLALVKDGFNGPAEMAPSITPKGRVILSSPQESGIAVMSYTVADAFGAKAQGNVRMTVTPDAPLKAPIARDDRVTAHQTLGKTAVEVLVLDNDEDPDGITEDLQVRLDAAPGLAAADAVTTAKGAIRIQLTQNAQMIPYTLTDPDGLSATAVIWVPGLGKQHPVLSKTDVIKVTAGESATMKLADYVKVRDGRTPRLTEVSKIALIGARKETDTLIVGDGAGINYAAELAFFGPGSITFEVTDGTGPDDPDGLKSTLTVLTDVAPAPAGIKNAPPTFTGASIDVPQAENVSYNVAPMAKDKDPDDAGKLTFKLAGQAPSGFKASLSGSVLSIAQAQDTKVGVKGTLQVSVADGSNPAVTADMVLVATSSSKPLAVANDDIVGEAHAGRAEVVKVLENDVNPFPDTPLRIVGAQVESGGQGVTASSGTDAVTVTSTPDYKGTVVVKYTVEDKTRDIARVATGRIKMVIKGKPEAPAKPQIVEEKDKSVLVSWDPPADNGSAITGYAVSWGSGVQQCATNTCTITGLRNATPYKFTVTATNDVGTSAPSPSSASATPDKMPDAPGAPTATFGDKEVTLAWVTPVGEFSAVKNFNVEISPAPAGQNGQKAAVVGETLTWSGLVNGTEYQFRVQAVNNAPKPSEWSRYSQTVIPAGIPDVPAAPSVTASPAVGTNTQVLVSWAEPFINGDAISKYTLEVSGGGEASRELEVLGQYSPGQSVTVKNSTAEYRFRVKASNKAGVSAYGALSAPQRAVGKVGQMQPPALEIQNTSGDGGTVKLSYAPLALAELNGYTQAEISYCVSLSSGFEQCGVANGAMLPSPNGASVTANVWVSASAGTASSVGDRSAPSAGVTPYGVPRQVPVNGSTAPRGDKTVRWTWSAPNMFGSTFKEYQYSLNGVDWVPTTATHFETGTGNFGDSATLRVKACSQQGACGAEGSAVSNAGPQDVWNTTGNTYRSCTEALNGISYDGSLPGDQRTCGGAVARSQGATWIYNTDTISVRCYISKDNGYGSIVSWYRIETGPGVIVGRYLQTALTTMGDPGANGVPAC